jgi:hypothetical protein
MLAERSLPLLRTMGDQAVLGEEKIASALRQTASQVQQLLSIDAALSPVGLSTGVVRVSQPGDAGTDGRLYHSGAR